MAVTFDAVGAHFSGDAASFSFSHTASGSNRYVILVVGCIPDNGTDNDPMSGTAPTYGGVTMTKLADIRYPGAKDHIYMWGLKAPATGSQTVAITFNSACNASGNTISYTGVDQTTPVGTTNTNTGDGTSGVASVVISSATGDLVVDALSPRSGSTSWTADASQTVRDNHLSDPSYGDASSEKAGAASVTMQWTQTAGTNSWLMAGAPLHAASGGGSAYNQTCSEILQVVDTSLPVVLGPQKVLVDSTSVTDATVGTVKAKGIAFTESFSTSNPAVGTLLAHNLTLTDSISLPSSELTILGHVQTESTETLTLTDTVVGAKNGSYSKTLTDSLNVLDQAFQSSLIHSGVKTITLVDTLSVLDTPFPLSPYKSSHYALSFTESISLLEQTVFAQQSSAVYITPAKNVCADLLDVTVDLNNTGIPITRSINTAVPLAGGGPLTTDLSLSVNVSGGGTAVVGIGRNIHTVSPVTGGGALGGDLTLGVNQFNSTNPGIVPASGGGTSNFLRADGTWAVGTVAGVSTVTGTAPINVSPTTGSVVVSASTFSSGASGIVPASGGGTSNFLRADGNWAPPLAGGGTPVLLQTGSVVIQSGMSDVSVSTAGAFTNFIPLVYGGITAPIDSVHIQTTSGNGVTVDQVSTGGVIGPRMQFYASRGSFSARTSVQSGDMIAQVLARATTDSGNTSHNFITCQTDGTPTGGDFQYATTIVGSKIGAANTVTLWITGNGMYAGWNQASRPSTIPALFSINGPISTAVVTKTSGPYTMVAADSTIFLDATSGNFQVNLPDPTVCSGCWLAFKRIDGLGGKLISINAGAHSIDGVFNLTLRGGLDAMTIQSDGNQWRVINWNRSPLTYSLKTVQAAINTTAARTALYTPGAFELPAAGEYNYRDGQVLKFYAAGQFGTTGTPTMRIDLGDGGGGILADSLAQTMPSSVSTYAWEFQAYGTLYNTAANIRFSGGRFAWQNAASGAMSVAAMRPATIGQSFTTAWYPFVKFSASSSSNTCTLESFFVELLPTGNNE